ncbi:MAG: alpha-amylase family glycosyl hydrolase [Acidimicrobiales bacterium]
MTDGSTEPWWKTAVVYQIYPRSFRDTTGDGVGDLRGIIDGLDHLEWLGVDALWLSPVFRSPMVDHGYDVSDYCDVDPIFGSLVDMDELVDRAHHRGLKVLLDWVPNHTSDQHPWFLASRSSRDDPKRGWYVWRDGSPDERPNDWCRAFPPGEPAWSWDEPTQAWFLHLFAPEQPDLNWDHPDVRPAMLDTLRFWLDRGVDGFRMDVVHAIGKGDDLPELTADEAKIVTGIIDVPKTHEHLREIRTLLDSYPGERTSVGEVFLLDPAQVAKYYGDDDELHLSFNFAPLFSRWRAASWARNVRTASEVLDDAGHWATWVLSNHDNPRHRTRYGGDERIARAAAVLLLTLRGTPFLYAGEELGLEDAFVPPERHVDPSGGRRDGCRAPIPWTAEPSHGWAGEDTWLPFPPEPETRNAATLRNDPGSILHLYRGLLALRRQSPALQLGTIEVLDSPDDVLMYERRLADDVRVVAISFRDTPISVSLGPVAVELSSDVERAGGAVLEDSLHPHEAVLLRPAG